MSSKNQEYTAKQIDNLTQREHVRKRPAMYMGGTDKGAFHNMLWQVLDEALDESQFNSLSEITITLLSDTKIRVSDNGMGIPTEVNKSGKPIFEVYMTDYGLNRRNYIKNRAYDLSGKLHAIHMFMMNALASECIAETKYDRYLWRQTYREGQPISEVQQIRPMNDSEETGTSITFTPDFTIMDVGLTFDYDLIVERCRELAHLLPQIKFRIEHENSETIVLNQADGIASWLNILNKSVPTLHLILSTELIADFEHPFQNWIATIRVNLAFQFRNDLSGMIKSYVNTYETAVKGVDVEGLETGLLRAIYDNEYSGIENPLYGLSAILHVYHSDPEYIYHTSPLPCFSNPEVEDIVSDCVQLLLAENPDVVAHLQNYFQSK